MIAHPAELCAGAPPAEALVEVQHGDVGEVGHARDDLQEPEALDGALVVDDVQHKAQAARIERQDFIACVQSEALHKAPVVCAYSTGTGCRQQPVCAVLLVGPKMTSTVHLPGRVKAAHSKISI